MDQLFSSRVVITGLGVVSGFGVGADIFWQGLSRGRSVIRKIESLSGLSCSIGSVVLDTPSNASNRPLSFAIVAAREALTDANIEKTSSYLGLSLALGWQPWNVQGPLNSAQSINSNSCIHALTEVLNIEPCLIIPNTSACAAGTQAIGDACRALRLGHAEVMLAGASDSRLHMQGITGYARLHALATGGDREPEKASRPFDRKRNGFVPGEGAAFLVLETLEHAKRRHAKIYAEILSYAMTTDAYRITDPIPEGTQAAHCISLALERAGIDENAVDYINAHGTSTYANDSAEIAALKKVFRDRLSKIPIGAMKSMIGHLSMASGAIETVGTTLTLHKGWLPPTINVNDPEVELDFISSARTFHGSHVLKNSFGFGGQNACLVLKRWND